MTIFFTVIFFVGLCLLLYPTVSNWWNNRNQSRAISTYFENVETLDQSKIDDLMEKARQFNDRIKTSNGVQYITSDMQKEYYKLLDISGTGVMAYIEIPGINVSLPVYHGVSDSVLQVAVGHIDWTSLPVGGASSHSVLSGHRGLPSAKLFTNLDKLSTGDIFIINILKETLTYQVDQILIVEPDDVDSLKIVEGKDYCTLVTCTPYGVNSHRLLVRGHRIANIEESPVIHVINEAGIIDNLIVASFLAVPMVFALFIYIMIKYRKKK
ncbi:MAG: class C sortase [Clostridia bacterium]|nr:class C sortase [Clostridia bacterium]